MFQPNGAGVLDKDLCLLRHGGDIGGRDWVATSSLIVLPVDDLIVLRCIKDIVPRTPGVWQWIIPRARRALRAPIMAATCPSMRWWRWSTPRPCGVSLREWDSLLEFNLLQDQDSEGDWCWWLCLERCFPCFFCFPEHFLRLSKSFWMPSSLL